MKDNLIFQLVDVSPDLIAEVVELNKNYYEDNSYMLRESYFDWFYIRNPIGKTKLITARIEGELIGIMALIPLRFKAVECKAYYAANVLSHPKHRDKNIFIKMIRCCIENLKNENSILIGHPNKNAIPAWRRTRMNFRDSIEPHLVMPKIFGLNVKSLSSHNIDDFKQYFSENKLIAEDKHLSLFTDFEYINWRYIKHPINEYKIKLVYKNEVVVGFYICLVYFGAIELVIHHEFLYDNINMTDLGVGLRVLFHSQGQLTSISAKNKLIKLGFLKKKMPYFITDFGNHEVPISSFSDDITLNAADF